MPRINSTPASRLFMPAARHRFNQEKSATVVLIYFQDAGFIVIRSQNPFGIIQLNINFGDGPAQR